MRSTLALSRMTPHEQAIIETMLRVPDPVSQRELMALMVDAPSQATMSRIMSSLIKRGFLIKAGQTRGARFSISEEARLAGIDPQQRHAIHYDPGRIAGYVPNKSRWLSDVATVRMQDAVDQADGKQSILPTSSTEVAERFLTEFCWASSSIAGNRQDPISTRLMIEHTFVEGQSLKETVMTLNHHDAISALLAQIQCRFPDIQTVQRLHVLMMRNLLDPGCLGTIRNTEMQIPATNFKPSTNSHLLKLGLNDLLTKAKQLTDPLEASFFLLVGFSYLQPFEGGNNRMGRLMANEPLMRAGLPPISFNGIDKTLYSLGRIAFFETGATGLLSDVFAAAYETFASGVVGPVKPQRDPHALEVHERDRIGPVLGLIFRERIPDTKIATVVDEVFGYHSKTDRKTVVEILTSTADRASSASAFLYGVTEKDIRERNAVNRSLQ